MSGPRLEPFVGERAAASCPRNVVRYLQHGILDVVRRKTLRRVRETAVKGPFPHVAGHIVESPGFGGIGQRDELPPDACSRRTLPLPKRGFIAGAPRDFHWLFARNQS